jgi:hypothetical protein
MLSRIYQASDARLAPQRQRQRITAPVRGVPVYVMLPLDTVWLLERNGVTQPFFIREKAMEVGLEMLSRAGVDGVMIDVWWGIVEHAGPQQYDFSAYRKLFELVASKGLKVQAVMSFHAGVLVGTRQGNVQRQQNCQGGRAKLAAAAWLPFSQCFTFAAFMPVSWLQARLPASPQCLPAHPPCSRQ